MARALRGSKPKKTGPQKSKVLIFGKPGVGKTWGTLGFPDVYYIDTEGGAKEDHYVDRLDASGALYFGPDEGSQDFEAVIQEVMTLATTDHGHRTLVIDSFSKLFNTAIANEEASLIANGKEIAFGNQKKPAIKFTRQLVSWIDKLDMNVILVCHERDEWHKGEVIDTTFDGYDSWPTR
jgi:hypothetical protein